MRLWAIFTCSFLHYKMVSVHIHSAKIHMRKSSFEWSDIRYFLAVVRTGKITVAARRLGVEHSTVSRRLAALERALGARLFDREPSGYRLTTHGDALLPSAEKMEALALASQGALANSDLNVTGMVRIGAPDGFGSRFLAPCIGRLADEHPNLEIQLVAMPRVFSLSKREADIAIGLGRPQEKRLHGLKLTDYRLNLYASKDYLAAHGPVSSVSALARQRLIGYVDDLIYARELDYLPVVSKDARASLKSSTLIAQLEATLAGAGVCVLPRFLAERYPELVRVLADDIELTRTFWLIVHADMKDLARVRVVADFIHSQVAAARDLF